MLRELRIRNYALIELLELDLPGGLVAFTGETGAGKSIIIGALALALGGKAQPEHQRSGEAKITVEAVFSGPFSPVVTGILREAGIPPGEDLVMRRIVPAGGKSRAYVNDGPVSLGTLESIGRELVDIHGQHQHQSLLRPETHLDYLDGFGKILEEREAFSGQYHCWTGLRQERDRLVSREREKAQRLDFLSFQESEIERAGLRPGEDSGLAAEREVLRHAVRLAEAAEEAEALLYSGDSPAAAAVHRAARRLEEMTEIDPTLAQIGRLLAECQLQLEEAGREIQDYHHRLDSNPGRLNEIEERLVEIGRLKSKFGDSVEEVLERLGVIRGEIAQLQAAEGRAAEIEEELAERDRDLSKRARRLSRRRERCCGELEKRVLGELKQLNMAGSAFEVSLTREEDDEGVTGPGGKRYRADERGVDRAEFLLSANTGESLKPLARIASGGELSRVMLAIKTVLAGVDRIPTMIFDEVDIGIGGKTARLVGDRLGAVSSGRQVLCVTHLPQIASLADNHYNIGKSVRRGRTFITVRKMEGPERVEELARMLGGRSVTAATRRHAAELLKRLD